ncbi:MAG: hypothetical protein CMI09_09010 [Oceanospirillaceae bacterium]|nr:hypothetical protein [Oceanospirillaceae bacterium]
MSQKRKDGIHALLKGLETGDPDSVSVINPEKYIQHNPQTHEGREGLAALFKRLSLTSPRVNLVRLFSDGDYVFGQTEYDFSSRRIGFEVFRFEDDMTVEHWDNIQPRKGPNASGHSMVDGETEVRDRHKTESNRTLVREFVEQVLINPAPASFDDQLIRYIDAATYREHSPYYSDDLGELKRALLSEASAKPNQAATELKYQRLHRVLAEGNFVLTVVEGYRNEVHTSFYDLFRLHQDKIVEHWSTTEAVPAPSEWKNDNGKF